MIHRLQRLHLGAAARLLDRHRRLAAAVCAAAVAGAAISAVAPAPAPSVTVLSAATDLPAGHTIAPADLRPVPLPVGSIPGGAFRPGAALAGRALALPMRRGEVVTDVRLVGSALLAAVTRGGLVGIPVRIADPAAVGLLRPGDHIDILGASDGAATAAVVAGNVLVVWVPDPAADAASGTVESGALLVVAAPAETSQRLAHAAIASRLSVVLRG